MSSRDERREFENDVFYEAYRRGLNPDRALDCADDCYYDGRTPEQCVDGYASRERAAREARAAAEIEQCQECPEEVFPEEFPETQEKNDG